MPGRHTRRMKMIAVLSTFSPLQRGERWLKGISLNYTPFLDKYKARMTKTETEEMDFVPRPSSRLKADDVYHGLH